ncbi:hypothetical protein VNI00_011576 [Paramarasmius palmivorus]|uniref:Uncharacterized protein n=1 Tax=Paramarasmius palmivorus TaxID=297713 RepID=A0AAW0CED2_9AGAR
MVDLKGYNKETGRYDVQPPVQKRPRNPLRTTHASRTQPVTESDAMNPKIDDSKTLTPSQASRKANREKKRLLYKLLFSDQRDWIRGSTKTGVLAAHWLNDMDSKYGNSEQKTAYKNLKEAIEDLLTSLKFHGDIPFRLDGRPNLGLLTVEDRCAMDMYGLIALGLDLGSLFLLSQCLARDNKRWDENPEGERPLTPTIYDPDQHAWRLIVLYPNDYLPDNAPLMILDPEKRTFRKPNDPSPPPPIQSDWIPCTIDDTLRLQRKRGETIREPVTFSIVGNREKSDFPSTFAMICCFASKVQAVNDTTHLTRSQEIYLSLYRDALAELVGLIYYIPPGRTRKFYAKVDAAVQAVEDVATRVKPSQPSLDSTGRTLTNEAPVASAQAPSVDQATQISQLNRSDSTFDEESDDVEKDTTFNPEKQPASDASQDDIGEPVLEPEPDSPSSGRTGLVDWRNGISSTNPQDIELPAQAPDTQVDDLGYTLAERAAVGRQIVNATNPTERAQAWQRMFFGPLGHPNYQRPPRYECEQWEHDSDSDDDESYDSDDDTSGSH